MIPKRYESQRKFRISAMNPGGKPLARQPSLEVFPTGTNVLLTLHGDVGYTA
jgi:hypothetical protein